MKIYKLLQVGMLASVFVLTGCASIVSHSNWPVTFKSEPSGAEIVITDNQGKQIHHGTTPLTVTLPSGSGYFGSSAYCIEAKLPGYQDEKGEVKASFNGWYVGNVVFGGLIGLLIVDPLTGAMYRLPHDYTVTLSEAKSPGATNQITAQPKTEPVKTNSVLQSPEQTVQITTPAKSEATTNSVPETKN